MVDGKKKKVPGAGESAGDSDQTTRHETNSNIAPATDQCNPVSVATRRQERDDFLCALFPPGTLARYPDEHPLFVPKRDPDDQYGWRGKTALPVNLRLNGYTSISTFREARDGWHHDRASFCRGYAFIVDDVGHVGAEGCSAKIALSETLHWPKPSAVVETSPGNFQLWYFFREPETDAASFEGLINSFINQKCNGSDPGMSAISRVGRLPGYENTKLKYGGHVVRLRELNEQRYTVRDLFKLFGLRVDIRRPKPHHVTADAQERIGTFKALWDWLAARGVLKSQTPRENGWVDIYCPWLHEHTGGIDNGAALRVPSIENNFWGSFHCHHGSCKDRGIRQFSDWADEIICEELESANVEAAMHGEGA